MTEIVTVETPNTTTTTPAPATGIAEAGAALRANGWGETPTVPAPPAVPVTPPSPPAADGVAAGDAGAAAPSGEQTYTQDDAGRWHRPDGQFANADEITALNALPADGSGDAAPVVEPDPAPEPIVVKLRARDGTDTEIEVTDPKVAELIRANHNDGMRREEFTRRMETVESKEAELREFETMLRTNPEAVILQRLPAERQVSIAVALVAQHWDAIADRLVAFDTNPTERVTAAMQSQLAIRDQQAEFQRATATGKYVAQVQSAMQSIVPESVDDATRERFLSDAGNDIARAITANGNQPIPVEKVREILAPRVALYGFTADGSTGTQAPAVPVAPARPVARPLARPSSTSATAPALTVATGKQPGAIVRRTVQAQRIAAAVAPQGAGAATVHAPLVPKDATVETAGKALRQQRGWGPPPAA